MKITYRPEIDGLREIAVLSVVFFHANIEIFGKHWFHGGFIGVDVFFVISGYLITKILLRELSAQHFSFLSFYDRRARRILPALILVMAISIYFGFRYMSPIAFKELGQSLLSSTFFCSNLFFYHLGGYNAAPSALKPLLHTWTLSVEEQFYLLFPSFLLFSWRFFKKYIFELLLVILLGSLIFAQWCSVRYPEASFYLFPTRAWELMMGSLLAKIEFNQYKMVLSRFRSIFSFLGLLMVSWSVLFFRESMHHPGFITLIPVLGTALIIFYSSPETLVHKILSWEPLRGIGLISYSLYLWHNPIFAFARIHSINELTGKEILACIALSIILSFFSWKWVESPFRKPGLISSKKMVFTLSSSLFVIVVLGAITGFTNLFPPSLPPELRDMWKREYQEEALRQGDVICNNQLPENACRFGSVKAKEAWYVVGDSHAAVLAPSLWDQLKNTDTYFVSLTNPGCFYAPDLWREKNTDTCFSRNATRRKILLSERPGIVVLAGRLPLYLSHKGYDNGEGGIEDRKGIFLTENNDLSPPNTLNEVEKKITDGILELINYGHRVILVYPIPETGWNIPETYTKVRASEDHDLVKNYFAAGGITTSYTNFKLRTKEAYSLLDRIPESKNTLKIYPEKIFCNSKIPNRCITHDQLQLYYSDDNHLSKNGARLVVVELLKKVASSKKESK